MAKIPNSVPLGGFIAPNDENDKYPVTNPTYGLGGLRTIGASFGPGGLTSIPQLRREEGMVVYVQDEQIYYHLLGGTGDEHWSILTFAGAGSTGTQGFQGLQGITGPTGVQGFQGFQGSQGLQGITGPAGSGKYFIGPTAPEISEEGLTTGSKWFNTVVGAEFTWITDQDSSQWIMVNVFSATGPQGPAGFGEGSTGFQGFQGFQGNQGRQGITGPTGVQGFQGSQGLQGITGPTGVQGFQGFQGSQGLQGITGPTGVQGFQGFQGNQGRQGITGPTGVQGFQGFQGSQGPQGITGPTGVQGFQGFQGNQGFQGSQGLQGITGPAGSGKYFIGPTAPESFEEGLTTGSKWFNTVVGAEFTWITDSDSSQWIMVNVFSATGPQGPLGGGTGNQGFQGFQGSQGLQGITGPTGVQGFQGSQGLQGTTGPTGVRGFQGFQGSQGLQGITGPTGVQGFQGFQGNQGRQGITGPTGVQGFQGFQGNQGRQGTTGPTGVQGFQGFQGITGAKGETGDGLFDRTYEPNTITGNTINYSSVGNVVGGGRKIPLLLNDGSLTFDYLRTTDIFDQFKVSALLYAGSSQQILEIGSGSYTLGATFTASYSPSISQVNYASISISGVSSEDFPVELSSPYTSFNANGLTFAYPLSANPTATVIFTLSATASSGVQETANRTLSFLFRRPNYYGVDSNPSLGASGLTSLSKILDINLSHSFEVNASDQYIYYSYPSTYIGTPKFKVNGFGGGFINIATATPHTNEFGYITNYEIYRSVNKFTASNIQVEVT